MTVKNTHKYKIPSEIFPLPAVWPKGLGGEGLLRFPFGSANSSCVERKILSNPHNRKLTFLPFCAKL